MAKEQIKEGTGVKDQHIIDTNESRRAFLKTAGIGVALFALAPANAFASVGGTTISPAGGVDDLWAIAIANARKNGEIVHYRCKDEVASIIPSSKNINCKLEERTTISGRPEHISAVAFYTVSDDKKKIERMRKLTVCATESDVTDKTYDHIIADGGRTLIVRCRVVLKSSVLGTSQACKLYMEYPRSGTGGFMRIERA